MRRAADHEVRIFEMVLADPPVLPMRLHRDTDGRILVPEDFRLPIQLAKGLQAQWLFQEIKQGNFPLKED